MRRFRFEVKTGVRSLVSLAEGMDVFGGKYLESQRHVARSSGGYKFKNWRGPHAFSPYVRKRLHENFEDDDSSRAKSASWDYAMDCAILGSTPPL